MYLRASEMSKQAWSEAVKTNNLEEHMLLDPLYYSFGDKEQKCWGVQVNVGGVQNMLGGGRGARMKLGGCAPPHPPRKSASAVICINLITKTGNSLTKATQLFIYLRKKGKHVNFLVMAA